MLAEVSVGIRRGYLGKIIHTVSVCCAGNIDCYLSNVYM